MIRTRMAPSPTGAEIHIGNLRTALFSYMWAKKNKGEFIIRIEDTDRKRYLSGTVEGLLDIFTELGIKVDKFPTPSDIYEMENFQFQNTNWLDDESLDILEESTFADKFIQTQRLRLYQKYCRKLFQNEWLYACFLSPEELEEAKNSMPKYQPFRSTHRFLSKKEVMQKVATGQKFVLRLNIEKFIKEFGQTLDYEDLVLGKMTFDLNTVDDQVMMKSNGIPTYHLAVVIDDHFMGITHPIRGYGWLPSTPKEILIYKALGWDIIPFGHATDILDPAGGKLSKRKGAVYVSEFFKQGYLVDALLNFLPLVGWKPKISYKHGEKEREIFSFEELISLFNLQDISKSNPLFDRQKLIWYNKQYLKMKTSDELADIFKQWAQKWHSDNDITNFVIQDEALYSKLALLKERAETLLDMLEQIEFFYKPHESIDWNIKQLENVSSQKKEILAAILDLFHGFTQDSSLWSQQEWESGMRSIGDRFGVKHGDVFMLCRVAVVGSPVSPPLLESLQILGKDEVLKRLSILSV